jgi:CheY-like chemotaxis protein
VLSNSPSPPQGQVLIVDGSEDTREVLRTALRMRGVQTLEASGARQGVELARQHHPRVIVLDMETDSANDERICHEYEAQSRDNHSCLLVLGRAVNYEQHVPRERIVAKPYHFAPLIRTIERLLSSLAET